MGAVHRNRSGVIDRNPRRVINYVELIMYRNCIYVLHIRYVWKTIQLDSQSIRSFFTTTIVYEIFFCLCIHISMQYDICVCTHRVCVHTHIYNYIERKRYV